ncbi:MAG: low molecular weight phosphotyrosine protein phosphatase, partial [Paramuribaculum sp.]|nr:low molecular weight phosphotyrosine protein phosphatase [Paramuribaculum sp.]
GMDSGNLAKLHELAPTIDAESKIMGMAEWFGDYSRYDCVPDPYYDGAEGFELVLDMLQDAILNIYDTIAPRLG